MPPHSPLSPRSPSAMPDLIRCCPVNLSFTISRHRVPPRWSMRSWESVRRCASRRREELPRSDGPSERKVVRIRANLRLRSRDAGFLPDLAAALAVGPGTATLDRTAVDLIRPWELRGSSGRPGERRRNPSPIRGAGGLAAGRSAAPPRPPWQPGKAPALYRTRGPGRVAAGRSAAASRRRWQPGKGLAHLPTRRTGRVAAGRSASPLGRRWQPGKGPAHLPTRESGRVAAYCSAAPSRRRWEPGMGPDPSSTRGPSRAEERLRARGRAG
jgi:hypothetical protein